ncbi:MAG: hypothetical protein AAGJ31_15580, partial [Verrucomicrobiota bacterium]
MKPRETVLLGITLGLLLVGGTFISIHALSQRGEAFEKEEHQLSLGLMEAESLSESRDRVLSRDAWIQENLPAFGSEE